MVFVSGEEQWVPGLHVKYAVGTHVGPVHASVGVVGGVVFTDHPHYGLGLSLGFEPFDRFHLHVGPLVSFEHGDRVLNASVAVAYPFRFNRFSIGPVTELTFGSHDYHWMTGLVLILPF